MESFVGSRLGYTLELWPRDTERKASPLSSDLVSSLPQHTWKNCSSWSNGIVRNRFPRPNLISGEKLFIRLRTDLDVLGPENLYIESALISVLTQGLQRSTQPLTISICDHAERFNDPSGGV